MIPLPAWCVIFAAVAVAMAAIKLRVGRTHNVSPVDRPKCLPERVLTVIEILENSYLGKAR